VSLGLKRRVAVTVAHFLALPFVVAASDMVGVLAERAAVRMADTTGLALFPLPLDMAGWTVHLLRSRQLQANPEIAWFSNLLAGAQRSP
jgi:DNA-binding transcriptional LysR family regulator